MKLQKSLTLDEAVKESIIDDSSIGQLIYFLNESLYETPYRTSDRISNADMEKLNKYLADNYRRQIMNEIKGFKFDDLTGTYRIRVSLGTLRIASFDKDRKEIKASILLHSEELKLIRIYDSYLIAQQEAVFGSACITFKLNDTLTIGEMDINNNAL
ncbi:hypothetical protein J7E50_12105 [Pedobacter sp. ISL-68]|uniref:hypothetical protein n=1 Tax=unclassified Pedobacter TaxID=2628915 RepID=UPI001BE5CB83|nr:MULTISPECIES: hypothetical protein [unclassified Pedobacter]MBT2561578.1 hypothetical protein [Pedobacter sp. ISL-64]MBT2590967.1 hypothetical protein [Pedobacter sp. ISL-68]